MAFRTSKNDSVSYNFKNTKCHRPNYSPAGHWFHLSTSCNVQDVGRMCNSIYDHIVYVEKELGVFAPNSSRPTVLEEIKLLKEDLSRFSRVASDLEGIQRDLKGVFAENEVLKSDNLYLKQQLSLANSKLDSLLTKPEPSDKVCHQKLDKLLEQLSICSETTTEARDIVKRRFQ